jgi:hypothetical protein
LAAGGVLSGALVVIGILTLPELVCAGAARPVMQITAPAKRPVKVPTLIPLSLMPERVAGQAKRVYQYGTF